MAEFQRGTIPKYFAAPTNCGGRFPDPGPVLLIQRDVLCRRVPLVAEEERAGTGRRRPQPLPPELVGDVSGHHSHRARRNRLPRLIRADHLPFARQLPQLLAADIQIARTAHPARHLASTYLFLYYLKNKYNIIRNNIKNRA